MRRMGASRAVPRCPHFRPFLLASGTHRASLPALSALFAGKRDAPCFVASVFADFRWQAGLRGGRSTEIPGQARNEVEVAPE